MLGGEGCGVGRRSGDIIPATASLALSTYKSYISNYIFASPLSTKVIKM